MCVRPRATIFLSLILIAAIHISFSQETINDTLSNAATPRESSKYEVVLDAGYFPFKHDFGGRWEGVYSLRAGGGKQFSKKFEIHFFVEYYSYKLFSQYSYPHPTPFDDNPSFSSRILKRDDIALYGMFTFGIINVGIGGNFSRERSKEYPRVTPADFRTALRPRVMIDSKSSRFSTFFTVGVAYKIPIGNDFYFPVGLYLKDSEYRPSGFPILFKAGIAKRF